MILTNRELATVLASLRFWQRQGKICGGPERDIATNGGLVQELSATQIDKLCERLNFSEL